MTPEVDYLRIMEERRIMCVLAKMPARLEEERRAQARSALHADRLLLAVVRRDTARRLRADGCSYAEIARRVGVSTERVRQYIKGPGPGCRRVQVS